MILYYQDRIIQTVIIFVCATVILGILRLVLRKRCKVKFFRIGILSILGVIVACTMFGYYGKRVNVEKAKSVVYSKTALLKDLEQLEDILFKENPLYYTDKNALRDKFIEVRKAIKQNNAGMTEEEFYKLINPLVVLVQCGHTNLSISKALQSNREKNAKFIPVEVYAEGETLIDKKSNKKIVSINEKKSADIIHTLLQNISHDGDNLAGAYYILNRYFPTNYYDFIEQSDEFAIQYQELDGRIETKVVKAKYDPQYNVNSWDLRMAQYEGKEYYTSSFAGDTATLRILVFMQDKQSFDKFLKQFFQEVKEKQCKKVIIDVRGNFGGDPRMAKELLSYLITKPFDYFSSDVTLLEKIVGYDKKVKPKADHIPFKSELYIDGACFSTCGHFAAIYQSLDLGKIIGEPTGGGSICSDGSHDIVLYQTGIRLHYSTKVFKVNADCEKTNVVTP